MPTGLDEFKSVLKEFRGISLWAGVGLSTASIPFVAAFAKVMPPFPGIQYITAIVQLIGIVLAFQLSSQISGKKVSRNLIVLGVVVVTLLLAYVFVFTITTLYLPDRKYYVVVGWECTTNALKLFNGKCPNLGPDDLMLQQYDEYWFWTKWSIAANTTFLVGVWFGFFLSLSGLVGQFLTFQRRRTVKAGVKGVH